MRNVIRAVVFFAVMQAHAYAQAADPVAAGKAVWGATLWCKNCHGANGEGGFGPDLAGRKLTPAQFSTAVRKPWGVMPAFDAIQITDAELANVQAYFESLPSVAQAATQRLVAPAGASAGQKTYLETAGCGQCHGPTFNNPRAAAGGEGADFDWFKEMVYDHAGAMTAEAKERGDPAPTRLRMGSYAPARLPESLLREIWAWAGELGLRPSLASRFGASATAADGVTYPFTVENTGVVKKGLTARDLTVAVQLPADAVVVRADGAGYKGVRHDDALKADVAEWKLSKLAPKDRHAFSLTLARGGAVRGQVRWTKPAVKTGPTDSVVIGPAPAAAARP